MHPGMCFFLIPERACWIAAIGICHFKYSAISIQQPFEFHENEIEKPPGVDFSRFIRSHSLGWWASYSPAYLQTLNSEDKRTFTDHFNVEAECLYIKVYSPRANKLKSYKFKFSCKFFTVDIVVQTDLLSWIEVVQACFKSAAF